MNNIFKNYKNWRRIALGVMLILPLLLIVSCDKDDNPSYGRDREPNAAIAFLQDSVVVKEGDTSITLNVGTSKRLFNKVSFEIVADSANLEGDTFLGPKNSSEDHYSINVDEKMTTFTFVPQNDDEFNGDAEGIRKVRVLLKNLQGEGAFLAESNKGSEKDENQMYTELTIYVIEDEQIPPFIEFAESTSSIAENSTEPAIITLNLSEATQKSGTISLKVDSTAVAGTHFTSTPPVINEIIQVPYPAGATKIEVKIMPIDNAEIDGNQILKLSLKDIGRNLFKGEITQHQLEIVDDDLPIKVTEITVEADAWTRGRNGSGKSDDNGGAKTSLLASGSDRKDNDFRQSYLKYDIAGIDLTKVIDAKVILTTVRENDWASAEAKFGGITTQSLYHVSDDTWGEMTITANTKPASGTTPIATYTSAFLIGETSQSNIEHEYDVTAQLQDETNDKFSVRLTTSNTLGQRIFYASKEAGDNVAPILVITESLE